MAKMFVVQGYSADAGEEWLCRGFYEKKDAKDYIKEGLNLLRVNALEKKVAKYFNFPAEVGVYDNLTFTVVDVKLGEG